MRDQIGDLAGRPPVPRVEFRIPISPTEGFFAQVRFFDLALRRLGGRYREANLVITVGDKCDLTRVIAQNAWSAGRTNVNWVKVPDEICDQHGMLGTANWRYFPEPTDADIIVLSDADTVLLRNIDPVLRSFVMDRAAVAGHMAHSNPPIDSGNLSDSADPEFWPQLFGAFDVAFPDCLYRYSMDTNQRLPLVPAYFNLGFVALNRLALDTFHRDIFEVDRKIRAVADSHMRCQIAVTIMAYRAGMATTCLPAEYNCANDEIHYRHNRLKPGDIRVVHYLRMEEIDRGSNFLPENLPAFLARTLQNPVNIELQRLALSLAPDLAP